MYDQSLVPVLTNSAYDQLCLSMGGNYVYEQSFVPVIKNSAYDQEFISIRTNPKSNQQFVSAYTNIQIVLLSYYPLSYWNLHAYSGYFHAFWVTHSIPNQNTYTQEVRLCILYIGIFWNQLQLGFPWSSQVTNGLKCYVIFRILNLESGFPASLE